MLWGSGTLEPSIADPSEIDHGAGALAVVLERAQHLDAAKTSGIVGTQTRVFVPGAYDDLDGPVVLGYDGSLNDPGADVQIGAHFFLQTQDYGTSEYLSLIGPTLVRITDQRDFDTFLADADRARAEGVFPDFLTHPMVRLCDVAAIGDVGAADEPRLRLHVAADGAVSTSSTGARLGELGEDLDAISTAWQKANSATVAPCAVALSSVVDESHRVTGLRQRPWLAQYHAAVAAVRDLRSRDQLDSREIRVSGFGGRLDPEHEQIENPCDLAQDGAPVLLTTSESAYLYLPSDRRTFALSISAGRIAESLLVHGSVEEASARGNPEQVRQIHDHFRSAGVSLSA